MHCREIYVLYGSQTGNAESLAVEFSEKLNENDISNKCMTLNDAKKINLKDVATFLVIIIATTGNGDAPENADGWWRTIKLRSAVSLVHVLLLPTFPCLFNMPMYKTTFIVGERLVRRDALLSAWPRRYQL